MELSKSQYSHLVRQIESAIKDSFEIKGGGRYDFSAPDTLEFHPLSNVPFFVEDDDMEGGGFFSSIGKAFKHVYGALKKSGVIDKAKDAALKKGRELGGQAINAAAQKVDEEAKKRGFDSSKITQAAVGKAQEALHSAEGHAEELIERADKKIQGSGLYQTGQRGQGMLMSGSGLVMSGGGFVSAPVRNVGMPPGARVVSQMEHLNSNNQVAAGGY
jgi:hypothetical protein